jgi:hypothetical protein
VTRGGIWLEGLHPVDLVAKIDQDAEGSPGKNGVGGMREDVKAREMFSGVGKARGHEEFVHGEVRKLYDRWTIDILTMVIRLELAENTA